MQILHANKYYQRAQFILSEFPLCVLVCLF